MMVLRETCRLIIPFFLLAAAGQCGWCQQETAAPAFVCTPDEAARMGRENSKELLIERLELQVTKKKYAADTRSLFPRFRLSFSADNSVLRHAPDSGTNRFAATLTQPILAGGRRLGEKRAKEVFFKLEERKILELEAHTEDIAWELAHRLILAEEKVHLRQKALGLAEEKLEIAETEHTLGLITDLELLDTRIETQNLRIDLRETELAHTELNFGLRKMCGIPQDTEIKISGDVLNSSTFPKLPYTLEELEQLVLENSSSLNEMKFRMHTKEEMLRRLRLSRIIPNIHLDVSFFVEGPELPLRDAGFSIKLSVSSNNPFLPIDTAFSSSHKKSGSISRSTSLSGSPAEDFFPALDIKTAHLALYKEQLTLEEGRSDSIFNLEQTVRRYRNLRERFEVKEQTIRLIEQKFALLEEKLALGEIKKTELLSAGIGLAEEKILLLEQSLELIETGRQIEQAAGLSRGAVLQSGEKKGWAE